MYNFFNTNTNTNTDTNTIFFEFKLELGAGLNQTNITNKGTFTFGANSTSAVCGSGGGVSNGSPIDGAIQFCQFVTPIITKILQDAI